MKVNLQDFALLHIGTYATTGQLGMGIRKETVLSSLMYVRERELYSVSYSLQCNEGMFNGFKCHLRLDYQPLFGK